MAKRAKAKDRTPHGGSAETPRAGRKFLLALIALAFVTRLWMTRFEFFVSSDGYNYAILAKRLISGNFKEGLNTYWSPLYPMLVGLSSLIFPDLEFAAKFVSVVAGSLLVMVMYFMGRELYGGRAAAACATLTAFYTQLIIYSAVPLTEATYALLLMSAIFFGWRAVSRKTGRAFLLTGFTLAACYLVKPEAFAYAGLFMVLAPALTYLREGALPRKTLLNLLLFLVGFIPVCAPYIFYLRAETGRWTISEKIEVNFKSGGRTFRIGDSGQTIPADRLLLSTRAEGVKPAGGPLPGRVTQGWDAVTEGVTAQAEEALGEPADDPWTGTGAQTPGLSVLLSRSAERLVSETGMLYHLFPLPFMLFAALGVYDCYRSRRGEAETGYLMLFLVSTLVGYALSVPTHRYLIPVLPILIMWCAKGIVEAEAALMSARRITRVLGKGPLKPRVLRPLIAAILLLSLAPSLTYSMEEGERRYGGREAVGRWMRQRAGPTNTIMAAIPWPSFYSGAKHLYMPYEEFSDVVDYARRRGVDYIVLEEAVMRARSDPRPVALFFNEGGLDRLPGLKLIYKHEPAVGYRIHVFEVVSDEKSPG